MLSPTSTFFRKSDVVNLVKVNYDQEESIIRISISSPRLLSTIPLDPQSTLIDALFTEMDKGWTREFNTS